MRIAFFGGSFDPPHRGHIAIAEAAVERLRLDRVLVAPVALQPLKVDSGHHAGFADRLAMVRLAVENHPRLTASCLDAPRPGGKPNYTLETLVAVRHTLAAVDRLFCLVGADSFLALRQWRRAAELVLFCDFIVAGRPGFPLDDVTAALPREVTHHRRRQTPNCISFRLMGPDGKKSSLYLLPGLHEEDSATEVRAALAAGSAEQTVLAPRVAEYIHAHALYRDRRPGPQ